MVPRSLAVFIDGVALPDEEARAFWARFSAHMEEHRGDLAGFAQREGFASVHPERRSGRAVLVVSRTAAQKPYGPAATGPTPDKKGTPPASSSGRKRPRARGR